MTRRTSRQRRSTRRTPRGVRTALSENELLVARWLSQVGGGLCSIDHALDAEMVVSELVGSWWHTEMNGADPAVVFGDALIDYALRRRSPKALALLRGLAVLGTAEQRERAAHAADALAANGVPDRPWVAALAADIRFQAWVYRDVYGDQTSVLLIGDRGGEQHGIAVQVDNTLGGVAIDAFVVADPVAALDDLRAMTEEPLTSLRPLSPSAARAVLEPALAAVEHASPALLANGLRDTRALLAARIRALPEPPAPPALDEVDDTERDRIVSEFVRSAAPSSLPPDLVAACARLIVDHGCAHDRGRPTRVSPEKANVFLTGWLPEQVGDEDPRAAAMLVVYPAWARWAAERSQLPGPAVVELENAVADILRSADAEDESSDSLVNAMLDRIVGNLTGREELAEGWHRQIIATPHPPAGQRRGGKQARVDEPSAYQIKVTLRNTRPPIWRRLVVPAAVTLTELHDVLQVAMGWTDSHLHQFIDGRRRFAPGGPDGLDGALDEARHRLRDLLRAPGDRLRYEYDFGDGWEHDIVLETATEVDRPVAVTCLAGRRACPPEDCGGPWGYAELCDVMGDPGHPEHEERREWLGADLRPDAFDRSEINRALATVRGW